MRETSENYKRIAALDNHHFEVSLTIGESGVLVTELGDRILFGGDSILVDSGNPDDGFRENSLLDVSVNQSVFKGNLPTVGNVVAGELKLKMIAPLGDLPKRARIGVFTRIVNSLDLSDHDVWMPCGVYYIDTRNITVDSRGFNILTVQAYDAIILADKMYPSDTVNTYPMKASKMLRFIAENMKISSLDSGIPIDTRTWDIIPEDGGYDCNLPVDYTMREVLGLIASAYCGNFIITDNGELRLVRINEMPPETRVLIDTLGNKLTFGIDEDGTPVYILV